MEDFKTIIKNSTYAMLEIKDLSKQQNVSVWTINDGEEIKKEIELFTYRYFPLIRIDKREKLLDENNKYDLFIPVVRKLEHLYFSMYKECMIFFTQRFISASDEKVFLENEIIIFKNRKIEETTYPLFAMMDKNNTHNINVVKNIKQVLLFIERNQIKDVDKLFNNLYDDILGCSKVIKSLISSVFNIVYLNFIDFLKSQLNKVADQSPILDKEIDKDVICKKATLIFDRAAANGVMDMKYKEDFIKLSIDELVGRRIAWNKSLPLLKIFVDKCLSEEIKLFSFNKDMKNNFIVRYFRPNTTKVKNVKYNYYSIKKIQSSTYESNQFEKILESIFSNL